MVKIHAKNLGRFTILCLQGRIVIGATEALRNAVRFQVGVSTLVLDFAKVSMIDAAGLGVMLQLRKETQSKSIGFKLMNLTEPISQVLEITRLNSVFEVTSAAELLSGATPGRQVSLRKLAPCA